LADPQRWFRALGESGGAALDPSRQFLSEFLKQQGAMTASLVLFWSALSAPVHPSIHLSIYLSVCLSIYLSVQYPPSLSANCPSISVFTHHITNTLHSSRVARIVVGATLTYK
jgi:hypothetical protein